MAGGRAPKVAILSLCIYGVLTSNPETMVSKQCNLVFLHAESSYDISSDIFKMFI